LGIIGWVGCLAVVGLFCDCDLLLCLTSLIGDLLRCLSRVGAHAGSVVDVVVVAAAVVVVVTIAVSRMSLSEECRRGCAIS